MCDIALRAGDGGLLTAHRVVLAATSGFFRSLFCGAGATMREGLAGSASQTVGHMDQPRPAQQQQQDREHVLPVVDMPRYSAAQLAVLLDALYVQPVDVSVANVAWLMDAAAYLELKPLADTCTQVWPR